MDAEIDALKMQIEKRKQEVQEWINDRVKAGQTTKCVFYITSPKRMCLKTNEAIKEINAILDRNQVTHGYVDTYTGAWNLNRDWIETGEIECAVEFCGVYPVNWNMDDVVQLEMMESSGLLTIMVDWVVDGKRIPNN